jgi:hypothetical protein
LEDIDDEGVLHSKWRDFFRQLCEYKVQFDDCIVPQQYAANPNLGTWVRCQRTRFRKSWYSEEKSDSVTAEQLRAPEGIGFNLGITKTDFVSVWSLRFQQMCEFKAQFCHTIVPYEYTANLKLGRRVLSQRCNYRLHQDGMPNFMTAERIRELESVGFEWGPSKTEFASVWSSRCQQLREFNAQFGHCVVPHKCSSAAYATLGIWVFTQRSNQRHYQQGTTSPMTEERIRELESVGIKWGRSETDLASIWSVRSQQLREFKVQFGHCLVPSRYPANLKLGRWVSTQRSTYRRHQAGKPSGITEERIRELDSV